MSQQIIFLAGAISTALALYSNVPYIKAVLSGATKPHQFSFLIFTIMNGIVTTSQYIAGARVTVLVPFVFFVFNIVILLLSLKFGTRNTSRLDWFFFAFSLATIVAWMLTKNAAVAIYLSVMVDMCASTMIVLKVRHLHGSEAARPWALGALAYVFACIALIGKPLGVLYVWPVYALLADSLIVLAIYHYSDEAGFRKAAKLKTGSVDLK